MKRARKPGYTAGVLLVLAGGCLWGVNATVSKYLMSTYSMDAMWLTSVRILCSCPLFFLAAQVTHRNNAIALVKDKKSLGDTVVMAFGAVLLLQVSYLESIDWTNAGTATVLQSLNLLIVLAYVCIRHGRRPTPKELAGTALALVGVFLVATGGNPSSLVLPLAGLAWGIANAASYSALSIQPVKLIEKWGGLTVNGMAFLFAGIAFGLVIQPWNCVPNLDAIGWCLLLFSIVFCTFGSYSLYMRGLKAIGPALTTLLSACEPIVAATTSILWLGTTFSATDITGFAMILAMTVLVV